MNGFKIMADGYRKAVSEGKINKDQADKNIRVLDFLGSCDQDDIYKLFDSSAFNEITKSYMNLAVYELINEAVIKEKQGEAVRSRFSRLFDEKGAREVVEV